MSIRWAVALWGFVLLELCSRAWLSRHLCKEAIRLLTELDLACERLLQRLIRPRYTLQGRCDQRGVCCQNILGDPPRLVKKTFLLRLYVGYHALLHNFQLRARGPNDELIFTCGHLQRDGRCGIYRYRPRLCRHYPILPFFGPPKLLPGCGYRVVPRVVERMQQRRGLPVVNRYVAVHHPTPLPRAADSIAQYSDYHLVDPLGGTGAGTDGVA